MSYTPSLFAIERLAAGTWIAVPAASISYSSDYYLHDHRDDDPPARVSTLVVGSETATVSLSRWDTAGDVLYPADRVRAVYDGRVFFTGTVESVTVTTIADPAAAAHGAQRRVDITASVGGYYAHALSRIVTWDPESVEPWIDRIRRFVAVDGW